MKKGRPRMLNTVEIIGDDALVKTSNGDYFVLDANMWDSVKEYTWRINHCGYVETAISFPKRKRIFLHRLLCNVLLLDWKKFQVDHINRNKLDNRMSNLRVVSNAFNQLNTSLRKDNTWGEKGISLEKRWGKGRWVATISVNKKNICLGRFYTKEEAIKARINGEKKYYGIER